MQSTLKQPVQILFITCSFHVTNCQLTKGLEGAYRSRELPNRILQYLALVNQFKLYTVQSFTNVIFIVCSCTIIRGEKITFWCSSFDLNSISSEFIKYKGVDSWCSICESHFRRFPILISNCLIANIVSSNFLFLKIKKLIKRYSTSPLYFTFLCVWKENTYYKNRYRYMSL